MNKNYRWTRSGARIKNTSDPDKDAGHFPWIENSEEAQIIFQEFLTRQTM
jgi:hypothetical protein